MCLLLVLLLLALLLSSFMLSLLSSPIPPPAVAILPSTPVKPFHSSNVKISSSLMLIASTELMVDCCFVLPPPAHRCSCAPLLPYRWLLLEVAVTISSSWSYVDCSFNPWARLMLLPMAVLGLPLLPPLQPKTIASRQMTGSNCLFVSAYPSSPPTALRALIASVAVMMAGHNNGWLLWWVGPQWLWQPIVILSAKDNSFEVD
jgi:hypothetical protein